MVIEYSDGSKDNHHVLLPVNSVIAEDAEKSGRIVTDSAGADQTNWKTLQAQNGIQTFVEANETQLCSFI